MSTPTLRALDSQGQAVGPLPEVTRSLALVDAMVEIDEHLDLLKTQQRVGWKMVPSLEVVAVSGGAPPPPVEKKQEKAEQVKRR